MSELIVNCVNVVVLLATLFVLVWTGKAVKRQADLLSIQIEQSKSPLLVGKVMERERVNSSQREIRPHELHNRGLGIAFDVCCQEGDAEAGQDLGRTVAVTPSTIGPGESANTTILNTCDAFTTTYKDIDGGERRTIVYKDQLKAQRHFVKVAGKWIRLPSQSGPLKNPA